MTFIVADDVLYARKAVEKMVQEWDAESVTLASCANSAEVMAQMERCAPDVLITDIRMPGESGLSLAATVQQRWPETRILLVTGYASFDYAREAIHSGVCSYLLKPLKKRELFDALDTLSHTVMRRTRQRAQLAEIRHSAEGFLLTQYLTSGGVFGEVPEHVAGPCAGGFAVAVLHAQGHTPQALCAAAGRVFGEGVECYMDVLRAGSALMLLYAPQKGEMNAFCAAARSGLRTMAELLWDRAPDIAVGVSAPACGVSALPAAYDQARHALCMRLAHPEECAYAFDRLQTADALTSPDILHALRARIQAGKWAEARSLLSAHWGAVAGLPQLEQSYRELLNVCYTLARESDSVGPAAGQTALRQLWDFETTDELWQYLRAVAGAEKAPLAANGDVIEELKAFLEENYYCELSLNELAATKYYMNPNYLSRLFKAKTGKGFARYLQEVRMRHAQELLERGGLSITEVASLVGYTSPSHFIQSFKKVYGHTPGAGRAEGGEACP